jgi:hypothetical protein
MISRILYPAGRGELSMKDAIQEIRRRLVEGRYTSEIQVSQGIVQRILRELGWDVFDTDVVYPEYPLRGLRVDFALCSPPRQPMIFIEIKQVGRSEGADQQLFQYAYFEGIPVGILTDGRTWSFYLPGGQGDFPARLVYKLDIVERDVDEVIEKLRRYLDYSRVRNGEARRAVDADYEDVTKARRAISALPSAWAKLVEEGDYLHDLLIEIVADKVQDIADSRPDSEAVMSFLSGLQLNTPESFRTSSRNVTHLKPAEKPKSAITVPSGDHKSIGFTFRNEDYRKKSKADVVRAVFELFAREYPGFEEKFYRLDGETGNRNRRYMAKSRQELNPNLDPKVCQQYELASGWLIDTKYDGEDMEHMIKLACQATGVRYGTELQVSFG